MTSPVSILSGDDVGTARSRSLVERVARALATIDGKNPDDFAWVQYPGGRPYGVCWRDQYADKAERLIEMLDLAALSQVSRSANGLHLNQQMGKANE